MLTGLFMLWTFFIISKRGFRSHAADFRYSWKEKFQALPKITPFIIIIVGVMYSLYGGVATPSEAAGVGAAMCVLFAVIIYRMWNPQDIWKVLRDTTRESVMILMIIGAAVLFGYMLASLYLTQTLAQAIASEPRSPATASIAAARSPTTIVATPVYRPWFAAPPSSSTLIPTPVNSSTIVGPFTNA